MSDRDISAHGPLTERRTLLKWSAGAIVGALAIGGKLPGLGLEQALAQTGAAMGKAVDLGKGDVGILNYAYALEQLEAAFYTQVIKTPYANMASGDREILTGIRDHELAHRDFFKAALKSAAIPALKADFSKVDFNSRDSVLTTARTFEDLGVAAYNGAGQFLQKTEYLLLAGKIVSVEARHASAIRFLIGANVANGGNATIGAGSTGSSDATSTVDDKGLDRALLPSEVLTKAGPFITTPISAKNIG